MVKPYLKCITVVNNNLNYFCQSFGTLNKGSLKSVKKNLPEKYPREVAKMIDEAKYFSLLNIFSPLPYTLSSSPARSASSRSGFLSSSGVNPLSQIQYLVYKLLAKLSSSHIVFLIADTTLLRKTGSKIEGVKKFHNFSPERSFPFTEP